MSRIGRIAVPAICLMIDAVCILLSFPLSWEPFAVAALFFAAAAGLRLALHELGHLLGGKISGYRLLFLRIGIFSLERDAEGRLRASLGAWRGGRCSWRGGQCAMWPGMADAGEACPYRLYNFGGILSDMIAGALGLAGCFLCGRGTLGSLFFLQLLWVGTMQACLNGIPDLRDGVPTDGYILRLLGREPTARKDYAAYLQVYAFSCLGVPFDPQAYDYPPCPEGSRLFYDALRELLQEYRAEQTEAERRRVWEN